MHIQCLAVVLSTLLQRELDDFVSYWNSHSIRSNRCAECPSGRPDDLFEIPRVWYDNKLHVVYYYIAIIMINFVTAMIIIITKYNNIIIIRWRGAIM